VAGFGLSRAEGYTVHGGPHDVVHRHLLLPVPSLSPWYPGVATGLKAAGIRPHQASKPQQKKGN
jgi:hypothetical protein